MYYLRYGWHKAMKFLKQIISWKLNVKYFFFFCFVPYLLFWTVLSYILLTEKFKFNLYFIQLDWLLLNSLELQTKQSPQRFPFYASTSSFSNFKQFLLEESSAFIPVIIVY